MKNAEYTTTTSYVDLAGWYLDSTSSDVSMDDAFPTITFNASGKYLILVDIQGVRSSSGSGVLVARMMENLASAGYASNAKLEWSAWVEHPGAQGPQGAQTTLIGGLTPSYVKSYNAGDLIKVQVKHVGSSPVTISQHLARIYVVRLA